MNYYSVPFGSFWILLGPFWEHMPENRSSLRPSTTCCQEAYVRVAILVLPLQVGPESIKAVEVLPKIHENTGSQLNGSLQTIFALKIVKFCALGKSAPAGLVLVRSKRLQHQAFACE